MTKISGLNLSNRALNILLVSETFAPSVGGVQTVTRLLAEAFSAAGHSATIVTRERGSQDDGSHPQVVRRPGVRSLLNLYRRADAVILQGMPLYLGWPLLLRHPCALIVHHSPETRKENVVTRHLRTTLSSRARHATVSRAMRCRLPWPIEAVLPNPYDAALFRPEMRCRTRDVVFLGRLVREKGARILIEALGILHSAGVVLTATIIGSGPERAHLEGLAQERKLRSHISFTGPMMGNSLAGQLNTHRILVVPSIHEPFGIVALEGAACGCAVIASNVGGLPEAVGSAGWLFPVGDAAKLAAKLLEALDCKSTNAAIGVRWQEHLRKHTPDCVARVYLNFLRLALNPRLSPDERVKPRREMSRAGQV